MSTRPGPAAIAIAATLAAGLLAGVGFAWAGSRASGERTREPVEHTVIIEATSFRPATLAVRPGDTVIWQNDDMFPHTATSAAGGFDSGAIAPGGSWRHTVGQQRRDLAYVCVYHPTMRGVLRAR